MDPPITDRNTKRVSIQISIDDLLVNGATRQEIETKLREGLIIRKYLDADLSLGEVAELLGMKVDETMDWLNGIGIPTTRRMSIEVEKELEKNQQLLMEELG